jgi:hypothetical protein
MKLQSDNKAELNSGHRGDLKAIVYRPVERGGGGEKHFAPGNISAALTAHQHPHLSHINRIPFVYFSSFLVVAESSITQRQIIESDCYLRR